MRKRFSPGYSRAVEKCKLAFENLIDNIYAGDLFSLSQEGMDALAAEFLIAVDHLQQSF